MMKPQIIYAEDEAGEPTETVLALVHPASQDSVSYVLAQRDDGNDGRSKWMWVRLSNGDLILGVFPQGDTYQAVERDAVFQELEDGARPLKERFRL